MSDRMTAIEELKLLQEIIARHEQHEFRVKGWLFAIMAGYTAALFSLHLHPDIKLGLSVLLLIVGFALWLTYHRMFVVFAMKRVEHIEYHLRLKNLWLYDGPKICESLAYNDWKLQFKTFVREFFSRDVLAPLILALLCLFLGLKYAPTDAAPPLFDHPPSPYFPPIPPCTSPQTCESAQPSAVEATVGFSFALCALLMIIGATLLLFGRGRLAKSVGTIAILGATGFHFALIKDFKFNIESLLPKNIEIMIDNKIKRLDLSPQYLGKVDHFKTGLSTIDMDGFGSEQQFEGAMRDLKQICENWRSRISKGKGLVLIVGSTDRLQLAGAARLRYEANAGLARARAEGVRLYLHDNCWSSKTDNFDELSDVLILVSGPRTTPSIDKKINSSSKSTGFPEDRRVDVYLLSGGPTLPPTMPVTKEP